MTCYAGGKLIQGQCNYNMPWDFNADTADSNPGNGKFKLNNADPSLATWAYVSIQSKSNIGFRLLLLALKSGNFFYVRCSLANTYLFAQVIGNALDGGTYVKIPILVIDSGNPFIDGFATQWKLWFPDNGGGGEITTLCHTTDYTTEYTESFGNWTQVGPSSLSIPTGTWNVAWQVELQQTFAGDSGECRLYDVTNGAEKSKSYVKNVFESFEDPWSTESGFICNLAVIANGSLPPWIHQIQFRTMTGFPLRARRARIFAMQTG